MLGWAVQDLHAALQSASPDSAKRHSVNAMLHARRGLACVVDWYLERDLAMLCKDPPGSAAEQARFLIARRVIDDLTSRVVERAVRKRNDVEHRFVAPPVETAEDAVELFRLVVTGMRMKSPPGSAPWTFGFFLGGIQSRNHERVTTFNGWSGPIVVFSRFKPQPWVGLVLPENGTEAIVRKTLLKDTTLDELVQLLELVERRFGSPNVASDLESCRKLAATAGLLNP